jgi:hypothetical protein
LVQRIHSTSLPLETITNKQIMKYATGSTRMHSGAVSRLLSYKNLFTRIRSKHYLVFRSPNCKISNRANNTLFIIDGKKHI